MENKSNISFRRQMELELIEEKYIALKIEISSSFTAINETMETIEDLKHTDFYKGRAVKLEVYKQLNKLL